MQDHLNQDFQDSGLRTQLAACSRPLVESLETSRERDQTGIMELSPGWRYRYKLLFIVYLLGYCSLKLTWYVFLLTYFDSLDPVEIAALFRQPK